MKLFKQTLFILTALFFTAFSFAQDELDGFDDDLDDLGFEDIACEDLPSAFDKYRDDVQLNQFALQQALSNVTQFLKESSQHEKPVKEELLETIKALEKANSLSLDNSLALSDQAYNISYFLPDCVKSESSAAE